MRYLSIDLAIRQSGVTYYDSETKELKTWTIKDTLNSKYKILDLEQINDCVVRINQSLIKNTSKAISYMDYIIIEWNAMSLSHLLEKFSISLISYLSAISYKTTTNIQPIQANRWLKVANEIFSIKRDKYIKGKEGNKKWISDLAQHLAPNHKFNTQDEKDSFVMLQTYLEKPNRF